MKLMPNKYVDFVSDEHFEKCVKTVCDEYEKQSKKVTMEFLQRNGLDTFKMIFDIMNHNFNFEQWKKNEIIRQTNDTISNWIGYFHQEFLGGVDGWINLGKGHDTEVDLKNEKDTIFFEIKNKHNTTKGNHKKNLFDTLKKITENYSDATAYYAYVIPKNGTSGEKIWKIANRTPTLKVREVWGSKVYEVITGEPSALKKTWESLPLVITSVLGTTRKFDEKETDFLKEIFDFGLVRKQNKKK